MDANTQTEQKQQDVPNQSPAPGTESYVQQYGTGVLHHSASVDQTATPSLAYLPQYGLPIRTPGRRLSWSTRGAPAIRVAASSTEPWLVLTIGTTFGVPAWVPWRRTMRARAESVPSVSRPTLVKRADTPRARAPLTAVNKTVAASRA